MNELVTICMPVYNGAENIETSLQSLLNQSYKNIIIVVCDNASTDDTPIVVNRMMQKDQRIIYKRFDDYLEVNYNFIRSLKLAKAYEGDIVCLYHADDWYYPDIVQKELQYIQPETVGAVFGKMHSSSNNDIYRQVDNEDGGYEIYNYEKYINEALISGTIFKCPTLMTKKSVLEKVSLNKATKGLISDMSFWLPIVRSYNVIVLNSNLMNYRRSENQLSSQIFHRRRLTISPQFILLDHEINVIQKNKLFQIEPNSIELYQNRRHRELIKISNNLKELGIDNDIYNEIICNQTKLTLQNIAKTETEYFHLLYGRH